MWRILSSCLNVNTSGHTHYNTADRSHSRRSGYFKLSVLLIRLQIGPETRIQTSLDLLDSIVPNKNLSSSPLAIRRVVALLESNIEEASKEEAITCSCSSGFSLSAAARLEAEEIGSWLNSDAESRTGHHAQRARTLSQIFDVLRDYSKYIEEPPENRNRQWLLEIIATVKKGRNTDTRRTRGEGDSRQNISSNSNLDKDRYSAASSSNLDKDRYSSVPIQQETLAPREWCGVYHPRTPASACLRSPQRTEEMVQLAKGSTAKDGEHACRGYGQQGERACGPRCWFPHLGADNKVREITRGSSAGKGHENYVRVNKGESQRGKGKSREPDGGGEEQQPQFDWRHHCPGNRGLSGPEPALTGSRPD